jgi:hypothetical protein
MLCVADVNPGYNPADPLSQEINITHHESIAICDEIRLEIECTKGGKGNRLWNARAGLDDDGEGVSNVCGRLGDYRTLPPMIVFNSSDSLDTNWCKPHASSEILDKDDNPLPCQY